MRRYALDSGIATDLMAHREPAYSRAKAAVQAGGRLGLPVPVYGELLSGIEQAPPASRAKAMRRLRVAMNTWALWPFDLLAAEEFGRIHAYLESTGQGIGIIDVQLAAVARVLGNCTVVSADSDLSRVPGLAVENWAA